MEQRTENPSLSEPPITTFLSRVSGYAANGRRYSEPRRLIFNIVLASVVAVHFVVACPQSWTKLTFNTILGLFFLAVLANVCCCAGYSADLSLQSSGLHGAWTYGRI